MQIFSGVKYYRRNYLKQKDETPDPAFETIGGKEIVNHDELDLKILRLLAKNARMPLIGISDKIKTPSIILRSFFVDLFFTFLKFSQVCFHEQ